MRRYLELLTGIVSGSDCTQDITVNLQMESMKGEDIVDDTTWIAKSHSPWHMTFAPIFYAQKIILVVRNPLDSIISWLHLCSTQTHCAKAPFDFEKDYPNYFDFWLKDQGSYLVDWMKVMMNDSKFRKVPMLWIRFEDLVMNPEPELTNVMRFLLGKKDLTGTNAERRIKEVIA